MFQSKIGVMSSDEDNVESLPTVHPPLQKLQSDSSVPSSTSSGQKRKGCVVKLDGCKYTIGRSTLSGYNGSNRGGDVGV